MSPSPRGAGRPQSIDPDAIAKLALELFAKHGYTEVSMAQIADAAGIARKSLYRYFSSKADLVWGGASEASTISGSTLRTALEAHNARSEAFSAALTAAFESLPDLSVTRGRLRLIAEQPELLAQAPVRMAEQNHYVYQYLVDDELDEASAHYLSVAYGSVSFAAWIRWATGDEESPLPYLMHAISILNL